MSRVLPILFNTDMVRAILDGRKTVTRRVMKPANPFRNKEGYCQGDGLWIDGYNKNDEPNGHIKDYSVSSCWMTKKYYIGKYAPYQPGDILYVRETWNYVYDMGEDDQSIEGTGRYIYCADDPMPFSHWVDGDTGEHKEQMPWCPSIHMPKEAARIWLKVTDVRVERLQDMDWRDALDEGVKTQFPRDEETGEYIFDENPIDDFIDLWDSTIKKTDLDRYGWDANPWVWVIEFECCEKPESEGI